MDEGTQVNCQYYVLFLINRVQLIWGNLSNLVNKICLILNLFFFKSCDATVVNNGFEMF